MARVAPSVAVEVDLRCEGCGYILNGLPAGAKCPECGRPAAEGRDRQRRRRPCAFEVAPSVGSFVRTSAAVLLRPSRFFGSLANTGDGRRAAWFARWSRLIAAALFAVAACCDLGIVASLADRTYTSFTTRFERALNFKPLFSVYDVHPFLLIPFGALVAAAAYLAMALLAWAAERFVTWAATSRGDAAEPPGVRRALCFHAAHYVPVALVLAATAGAHLLLLDAGYLDWRSWDSSTRVTRYVLAGEALLGAVYLYRAHRVAMRKMMYVSDREG